MLARRHALPLVALLLLSSRALAAETQILYLSGKGKDDGVKWDFTCNAGMNANKPSTINVPSNWELQGFGTYTYGTERHPNGWPKVQGIYKRTFTTPTDWKDLQTSIVFEGVMTDATVLINGQSAGPTHQGGYYRFQYDITKLLKPVGEQNTIEVTVDDESANPSVNNAERRGDYWNYGGIFRPVYLQAVPAQHVERVAIDAKADGTFNADVILGGFPLTQNRPWWVQAQILDLAGKPVGDPFPAPATFDGSNATHFSTKVPSPRLWTAETPNLYQLEVRVGVGQTVVHSLRQKFGFRTIEARPGEGLFVNGKRIFLKGTDRHSFWPDSGRCLSEQISRDDIALMKDMNANAVRMSHYPPDQHFLDACDEMGMYVLDELAGWHAHYDDAVGHKLVEEMVTRDVNHPSILFWDNGNEGGWNNNLNDDFAKWDLQKRNVLHPWELFRGIDTKHYPDYNTFVQKANANNVFFPTEFLHGLYDGGAGAGLEDYWNAMLKGKSSAGGFIWAFLDEDVKRTDKNGILDSNGNQAPDGIVDPYREKEGSFYTIKQIWSPIALADEKWPSDGAISVENRYNFIDLNECTFSWELRTFASPAQPDGKYALSDKGIATPTGSIPPGAAGKLSCKLNTPIKPGVDAQFDAFALTAKDPAGREVFTKVWPIESIDHYRTLTGLATPGTVAAADSPDALTITTADLTLAISKKTGFLTAASRAGRPLSLLNGPKLLAAAPPPPPAARGAAPAPASPPLPASALTSLTQKTDGTSLVVIATYTGPMKSITYTLRPNAWLTIDYAYNLTGDFDYFGVGFDYPESSVKSMRYLGNGPATVYQNRLPGGTLDVWEKTMNQTIDGDPDTLARGQHFAYPVFKGFYAGVKWLTLTTSEGPITALLNQDDLFVQLFTPDLPPANIRMNTALQFPKTSLAFLHAIPAMGSKFARADTAGPHGQPAKAAGDYQGSIALYFGDLKP